MQKGEWFDLFKTEKLLNYSYSTRTRISFRHSRHEECVITASLKV